MKFKVILAAFFLCFLCCCDQTKELKDVFDARDPDRKPINTSILGANAFVADSRFGNATQQFSEIKNSLKLKHVRILQAWTDAAQPTPSSPIFFGFFDDVLAGMPAGMDAIVVITGLPSWMSNPANWIDGDPRKTWIEKWLRPNLARYGRNGKVIAWQIWNEPNMFANPENVVMEFAGNPDAYFAMLNEGVRVVRNRSSALVVNAATTAINQNFPETINYNKELVRAGITSLVDVYAIHYYGKQFENVVRGGGVKDFVNGLGKPVWVTESGDQGVNKQLAYGEQVWNFLTDEMPSIQRIYQYQFAEASDPASSYGMRTLSGDFPVSDLYIFLKDR